MHVVSMIWNVGHCPLGNDNNANVFLTTWQYGKSYRLSLAFYQYKYYFITVRNLPRTYFLL